MTDNIIDLTERRKNKKIIKECDEVTSVPAEVCICQNDMFCLFWNHVKNHYEIVCPNCGRQLNQYKCVKHNQKEPPDNTA